MKTAGRLSPTWGTRLSKKLLFVLLIFSVTPSLAEQNAGYAALGSTPYFGCATCHGWSAEGSPAHKAPAIAGLDASYLLRQLNAYANGQRGAHRDDHYGAQMVLVARAYPEGMREQLANLIAALPAIDGVESGEIYGNIEEGKVLYGSCAGCHGDAAQGNESLNAPALNKFSQSYLQRQLHNYNNGIRGGPQSSNEDQMMSSLVQAILTKSSDIESVVAHIVSLNDEN